MRTLAIVLAASLAVGCTTTIPATGTVVELDADPGVRDDATEVVITVRGAASDGTAAQLHEEIVEGEALVWPLRISIAPDRGDASRTFALEATARDASGVELGTVRASSGFIAQRTLFVHLVLEECCRATRCDEDETCSACSCVPSQLDPIALPDFDPDRPRDAGRVDGGVFDGSAFDAGRDAAASDARADALVMGDAFVPDDAPTFDAGECTIDSDCRIANGLGMCTEGTCVVVSCDLGRANCDGRASTGCEVDTTIDPDHCGACETSCDAASATTACVSSTCAVVACEAGRGNCDGSAASGCETDTTSSDASCGTCGHSCALRGTLRECRASSCASLGCMPGFTDCSAAIEGCEAYLSNDRNNCGACGRVCGGGELCSNGGCCPLGFDSCGGACVNMASDRNNCGSCGNVCASGLVCFDYECVS